MSLAPTRRPSPATAHALAGAALLFACASAPTPPAAAPTSAGPCPDFWNGAWTAMVPAGGPLPSGDPATAAVKAADASFKPLFADACTYLERWDTVPMADGKSRRGIGVHRRDPARGTWSQLWIDNAGAEHHSAGQDFERGVRYAPTVPPSDGAARRQTIVPQPDGTVRNYGEASRDGGQTWQLEFDFRYTRK